ncbi:MAG: hypothetical protein HYT94_01090 [Parcubacteria group bacterium]|nr:hypothetical protein [Parcubacteria group bacterium]
MSKDNIDKALDRAFRPLGLYFLTIFFCASFALALILGVWAATPIVIVVSAVSLVDAIYEWFSKDGRDRELVAPIVFSNIVMWCAYFISTHPGVLKSVFMALSR